jgi:transcriptional regulator with XRE-family HTH domain
VSGVSYADRLRKAIAAAGLSNRRAGMLIAERLGTDADSERRALYKYLRGDSQPEAAKAEVIAEVLGVPALALVDPVAGRRHRTLLELEDLVIQVLEEGRARDDAVGECLKKIDELAGLLAEALEMLRTNQRAIERLLRAEPPRWSVAE